MSCINNKTMILYCLQNSLNDVKKTSTCNGESTTHTHTTIREASQNKSPNDASCDTGIADPHGKYAFTFQSNG